MSKATAKQVTELCKAARKLLREIPPALDLAATSALAPALSRVLAALEPFDAPPAREVTVNAEQALYVIPESHGYSCLGFDVLISRYNAVAAWLRKESLQQDDLPPEARGSMRAYTAYRTLLDRARSYCERNNLRCPAELTPQLTGLEGKRVEVVDQYGERRRFQVGKSTGWLPIHLEIARRNSSGGPAVTGAPFQSVRIVA
jgi:hypothetical protein